MIMLSHTYMHSPPQVLNGPVFAGEGILMGSSAYSALAVQTLLGAGLMVAGCLAAAHWGFGLTGIWLAILVFNLVQLVGVLLFVYVTGPLRRATGDTSSGGRD